MQMAAIQYHTPLEYVFVDAPHAAEGPPDEGIGLYYPNQAYYEWYLKSKSTDTYFEGLDESIRYIISVLVRDGPFDGIIGFSQGAAMATSLIHMQESGHKAFSGKRLFKFAILIGGVPPKNCIQQVA